MKFKEHNNRAKAKRFEKGQKVLVRDFLNDEWREAEFDSYTRDRKFTPFRVLTKKGTLVNKTYCKIK